MPSVYEHECDPVYAGASPVHCLMWADDCVVLTMDKTASYLSSLGLSVNVKKTKVLIFNTAGFGT